MAILKAGLVRVHAAIDALPHQATIVDYLLPRSPHAAKRILLRLIDATTDLAMFPNIGREGKDGTREWVVFPYILLYEVDNSAKIVSVLCV